VVLASPYSKIERQILLRRPYDACNLTLVEALCRPGDTFLDVGANIGVYSLVAGKSVGSTGLVVALEPHPLIFRRLLANCQENPTLNVVALQAGAGEAPDFLQMFLVKDTHFRAGVSSLLENENVVLLGEEAFDRQEVSVVTLDSLAIRLRPNSRLIVKMDVEGYEIFALKGMTTTLRMIRPWLIIEHSSARAQVTGQAPEATTGFLAEHNYCLYEFRCESGAVSLTPFDGSRSRVSRDILAVPREEVGVSVQPQNTISILGRNES